MNEIKNISTTIKNDIYLYIQLYFKQIVVPSNALCTLEQRQHIFFQISCSHFNETTRMNNAWWCCLLFSIELYSSNISSGRIPHRNVHSHTHTHKRRKIERNTDSVLLLLIVVVAVAIDRIFTWAEMCMLLCFCIGGNDNVLSFTFIRWCERKWWFFSSLVCYLIMCALCC